MLGRISTVLQNAVDALAPPVCPLHDFIFHWKMVMKFYINGNALGKTAIESTNIPERMEQLLKILLEEDSAELNTTGPCLEYLLQHRILDLLVTLAETDCPPGMKQHTFTFVRKLITQIQQPILPHVGIYQPLQRLISLCSGMRASPTESYEIAFLCSLCAVISKQPQLTTIFNNQDVNAGSDGKEENIKSEVLDQAIVSSCGNSQSYSESSHNIPNELKSNFQVDEQSGATTSHSQQNEHLRQVEQEEKLETEMSTITAQLEGLALADSGKKPFIPKRVSLLDALLTFLHSADSRVTVKACEGLMVITSLPSDVFARWVIQHSDLCMVLATRLQTLYGAIPLDVDPNDLDEMQVNWGLDSPLWSDETIFPGCRQVASFLAWLDYCDQLVRESYPIIGLALAVRIRTEFLEAVLGPALLHSKQNLVVTTAFITKCLKQTTAPALLTEFIKWLIGDQREPELPGVTTCQIRHQLLENCFHEQNEISLETLRLFEVILEKPCEYTVSCLISTYLNSRSYYNSTLSDTVIESWSDEEDEREKPRDSLLLDFSPGSSPVSRTLAPSNIHKIINSFLFLLPPQFHSTTDPDECGYEQYIQDADKQYQMWIMRSRHYSWPTEATFPDTSSSDSRPEADHGKQFYEGPFLRMILSRLLHLPYQPYEISLQVTSIVSRLALLPHPYIHEFILNPLLPVLPDVNTVFTTLEAVAGEIITQIPKIPNSRQLLHVTRQRLLGDGPIAPKKMASLMEEGSAFPRVEAVIDME
ncbi:FHF complex subunit HOOK interacting protein 2A isoform X2 [Anabrus simplex]|uniref:FHF complex subunit HOOK interacting protein 2A isoform X2 n=1 Tax=Anabrus simplex TaxID=316456 RepID=UPI0035A3C97E